MTIKISPTLLTGSLDNSYNWEELLESKSLLPFSHDLENALTTNNISELEKLSKILESLYDREIPQLSIIVILTVKMSVNPSLFKQALMTPKLANHLFHKAAAKPGLEEMVLLLDKDLQIDVNIRDEQDGWTPLHIAAEQGHDELIALLIARGADLTKETDDGYTALFLACDEGHLGAATLLIETLQKTDTAFDVNHVYTINGDQWTLLLRAARGGDQDIVELLLMKGADPLKMTETALPPLYFACSGGHLEIAQLLYTASIQLNPQFDINTYYKVEGNEWTLLHMASYFGHTEVIGFLLERGANANLPGHKNATPLFMACMRNMPAAVAALLKHTNVSSVEIRQLVKLSMKNNCAEVTGSLIQHHTSEFIKDSEFNRIMISLALFPTNLRSTIGHFMTKHKIDAFTNLKLTTSPIASLAETLFTTVASNLTTLNEETTPDLQKIESKLEFLSFFLVLQRLINQQALPFNIWQPDPIFSATVSNTFLSLIQHPIFTKHLTIYLKSVFNMISRLSDKKALNKWEIRLRTIESLISYINRLHSASLPNLENFSRQVDELISLIDQRHLAVNGGTVSENGDMDALSLLIYFGIGLPIPSLNLNPVESYSHLLGVEASVLADKGITNGYDLAFIGVNFDCVDQIKSKNRHVIHQFEKMRDRLIWLRQRELLTETQFQPLATRLKTVIEGTSEEWDGVFKDVSLCLLRTYLKKSTDISGHLMKQDQTSLFKVFTTFEELYTDGKRKRDEVPSDNNKKPVAK